MAVMNNNHLHRVLIKITITVARIRCLNPNTSYKGNFVEACQKFSKMVF